MEEVRPDVIPDWNTADLTNTRRYGDAWYAAQRTAVLLVPSVLTGGIERNVLLNQQHADFWSLKDSKVREVIWDQRLFGGR